MEIISVNNDLVKETVKLQQKKYRTQTGKFLLEGYKAIKEAFDSDIQLEYIFVNEKHTEEYSFAKNILIITNDSILKNNTVQIGEEGKENIKVELNINKLREFSM